MKEIKTITLDELIETLKELRKGLTNTGIKKAGETKVFLSSDSEGNSYSTIDNSKNFMSFAFYKSADTYYGNSLVIYPFEEYIELFVM